MGPTSSGPNQQNVAPSLKREIATAIAGGEKREKDKGKEKRRGERRGRGRPKGGERGVEEEIEERGTLEERRDRGNRWRDERGRKRKREKGRCSCIYSKKIRKGKLAI
ncbi:hypothetical protein TIFTF001_029429 [Ficus carica]|uniref:Uncharacterized protein n=1 Tax=Ficus carica TaxID=3494 RepID=A0AA88DRS2_FICCA|nr:hypothetical protein TIFTF001_029429 [Ficus carica]